MSYAGKARNPNRWKGLFVAAATAVAALSACGTQSPLGARAFGEDTLAVQCPAGTRKFCHILWGSKIKGNQRLRGCWCD